MAAATEPREAVIIRLPVPPQPAAPAKRRSPWLVAAVVLIAAAAAAVAVIREDSVEPAEQPPVIQDLGGLPALPPGPVNAVAALAAAVSESEVAVPPGQYLYIRMEIESRSSRGEPVMKRINETWLPAEVGQEMMVRHTEPGQQPQENRLPRVDYVEDPPLEATPAAQYQAMRARLGTALDAPERARDELLMPLAHALIRPEERKLRLATVALLPKVEVRDERLADGTPVTLISSVAYNGANRMDIYFDRATARVIEVRTIDFPSADRPTLGSESIVRYSKPVVVPSIGAIP